MKCPKCGSERIGVSMTIGKKYRCHICKTNFDDDYQQRLDKVLSKFDKHGDYLIYKNIIMYDSVKNEFWINDDFPYLSLTTVESLLKDLNEQE
jgi:DNA-directed RNA polymerase subunit RPC12/RpoP